MATPSRTFQNFSVGGILTCGIESSGALYCTSRPGGSDSQAAS